MNLGQLLGGAGVVGQGWRQAEEAERVARQNQLVIEEQNRVADLKQRLAGLQMPSFQPVDVAQYTQQFMPGQMMPMGAGEVPAAASAAPVPAPAAPVPAPAIGGAQPLPAGVRPSQAGAGRGFVNPPLVGQPQPQVGAVTAPVTPQTNLVATTLPPAIESLGRQFDAARTQYRQAQDALRQFGLRQRQQNPSGFAAAVAAEAAAKQALGEAQNAYETGVSPYAKPLQAGGIRLPALAPAAAPAAPGTVPATAPGAGPAVAAGATRSDRNNNPGNLIYNEYTKSLGATGKDKDGFAIFPSMAAGQAASLSNLQNYGQKGVNTVEGIINRWSPPNGKGNTPQGTQNYINFVAQQLGVDPKQPLNMGDTATLQALNAAIRRFEGTGAGSAAAPGVPAAVAAAPGAAPAPMEVPQTQARNMELAEFYLANPESIPMELQQINQMAQQQAALLTRQRNEAAQLAQVYMSSGTQPGIETAMRLRDNIGQLDASLLQLQQQVVQKQMYLQGMQGLREFAGANDPRRLSGVLSQYMGAPVGIQPRPDGKYNYFVNGKKVQEGLTPDRLAAMALREFSPEARQAAASEAALKNELALKLHFDPQRDVAKIRAAEALQKAIIEGEYKIAEERAKQLQGKLTIDTSKGVAYFQQGNRVFVINPDGKVEETPLGKVELPPTARPVAGLNMGR